MFQKHQSSLISKFTKDSSGESAMYFALMFGALAVVGALVAAPLLDKASRQYADNQPFGIDPITTASTKSRTKTYVIRRSVLDDRESIICQAANGRGC